MTSARRDHSGMNLFATKAFAILFVLFAADSVFAQVECQCPDPPGGRCSCPADHIAFCKVVSGECSMKCKPRSEQVSGPNNVARWIMAEYLGEPLSAENFSARRAEFVPLMKGVLSSPVGPNIYRFPPNPKVAQPAQIGLPAWAATDLKTYLGQTN